MLREINIQAVQPIVQAVEEQRNVLGVFPNTPLAELASLSIPALPITEATDMTQLLRGVVNQPEHGETHGEMLDIAVEAIATSVRKQMKFARGVVLPAVSNIITEIKNTIGEREPSPWQIEQADLSELVECEAIRSLVDRYGSDTDTLQNAVVTFPIITDEASLLSLLETGSSSVNTKLLDLIAAKPTGWILSVYNAFFRGEGGEYVYDAMKRKSHRPTTGSKTRIGSSDDYAVALILAMNMIEADPLPESNMSLADYRRQCSEVQKAAATLLSASYRQFDKFCQTEVVIINAGMDRNTITVFGPMYRKFLENYTAEVVIGQCLLTPAGSRITAPVLAENANQCLLRYKRWVSTFEDGRNDRLVSQIPTLLVKLTSDYIRELPDADNCCGLEREEMIYTLIDLVKQVDPRDWLECLYPTARKVICKAIWSSHSALGLLEAIDQLSETLGSDVDVRVLAYHAVRRLVVAHVGSMLTLELNRS